MRTFFGLSVLGLSVFLTTVTIAQQPAVKKAPAAARPATSGAPYKCRRDREGHHGFPDRSVLEGDLRRGLGRRGADRHRAEGAEERRGVGQRPESRPAPRGRREPPHDERPPHRERLRQTTAKDGELPPDEIEKLVAKDRASWIRLAQKFSDAAQVALKAANGKSADGISDADEGIDGACENCHLKFWYPDQEKLLADADKKKQQKK